MIENVGRWPTNSELVRDAFALHVWRRWRQPDVLDPTYGRGGWWNWVTPRGAGVTLVTHDIRRDGIDYRALPDRSESFDVVTFDPDYIAPGGRKTSTIPDFNDRYGLVRDYESPAALQASINGGVTEAFRVLRPQGLLMVKCMNYISSGSIHPGVHLTWQHAIAVGFKQVDEFIHAGDPGPQPKHKQQLHARAVASVLLVFKKPGRRKKEKR